MLFQWVQHALAVMNQCCHPPFSANALLKHLHWLPVAHTVQTRHVNIQDITRCWPPYLTDLLQHHQPWKSLRSFSSHQLFTIKFCVQCALVHTQGDFSLLSTGKIEVGASDGRVACVVSPPIVPVSAYAWVVQVSWFMRRQSGYYATCYSSPWLGQRSGAGQGTRHWVISLFGLVLSLSGNTSILTGHKELIYIYYCGHLHVLKYLLLLY